MPGINCSQCGKPFNVPENQIGTTVFCPHCGGATAAEALTSTPPTFPGALGESPFDDSNKSTSGMAISSLICSLVGFCIPLIPGVLGLVLGIVAMGKIDNPANRLKGRGLAQAGAILGGVSLIFGLIIPLLLGLLLPALGAARKSARMMQNSSQLKGVHQSMYTFAQSNRSYFPGVTADGRVLTEADRESFEIDSEGDGAYPAVRYELLLDGDYFMGMYLISSAESKTEWTHGALTTSHYSYAMLSLHHTDGELQDWPRNGEWRDTANSLSAILSDRNVTGDTDADGDPNNYQSIWTHGSGDWRGSVAWNDNHVAQETTGVMDNTQYGKGEALISDNLFVRDDGLLRDRKANPDGRNDANLNHADPSE